MINFASNLNKMIDAGLGGPLDPPRTEVAVGHRVVYTEVSGDVVNFETNVIAPVKNLRVTMEPIQDLHGQDAPYPAGGGTNLLPPVLRNNAESLTNNGVTLTIVNQKFHLSGTGTANGGRNALRSAGFTLPAGTYTRVGNAVVMEADTTILSTTTFTLTEATEIYIGFSVANGTVYNEDREIAIVKGDTAVAWSPYENICPITGRESVTVWQTGGNLIPLNMPSNSFAGTFSTGLGTTVYGGTLDVTTGVLTVNTGYIAVPWGEMETRETHDNRIMKRAALGFVPVTGADDNICSVAPYSTNPGLVTRFSTNVNGYAYVYLPIDADDNILVEIASKMSTPITINLTPAQLSTIKGQNNVWSDAGNISLKYPYYEETEGY